MEAVPRTWFVYALCEPDGKTVRYVGVTSDLLQRFRRHLSAATFPAVRRWVDGLRHRSLIPAMIVLSQHSTIEEGLAAESAEIARRVKAGQSLLNLNGTGTKPSSTTGRLYEHNGLRLPQSQWAKRLGISRQAMSIRLQKYAPDVALSLPKQPGECLVDRTTTTSSVRAYELSREERRERRRQMAEMASNGKTISEVAASFSVTTVTVKTAVREFANFPLELAAK